jgi:hypothetical protein
VLAVGAGAVAEGERRDDQLTLVEVVDRDHRTIVSVGSTIEGSGRSPTVMNPEKLRGLVKGE